MNAHHPHTPTKPDPPAGAAGPDALHLVTPPRPSAPPLFLTSAASPVAAVAVGAGVAPPPATPGSGGVSDASARAASPAGTRPHHETAAGTTSSDVSGFSNRAVSPGGGATAATAAAAALDGSPALLPKHTRVRVTGNARTRPELIGLEGKILTRGGAGLGGWHQLVLSTGEAVRLQRNALAVVALPTGDETESDDDAGAAHHPATAWARASAAAAAANAALILPRKRHRRPPKALLTKAVAGGGVKKGGGGGAAGARSPTATTSSGGATTTTAWVPRPSSSSSPPPTASSSVEDWLASRLGGPALRRYAAHFGLASPAPSSAAAHWVAHALVDEHAVAGAFVLAAGRRAGGGAA